MSTDQNLLFGVLAWQNGLIKESELLSALKAWSFEKATPLGDHLVQAGALSQTLRERLDRMVVDHIALFDGDPVRSLQALSSVSGVTANLRDAIPDEELQVSLDHLVADEDPLTATYLPHRAQDDAGRFQILRECATGGLGRVSVALDSQLNREVALKEIRTERSLDKNSQLRFLREAEITGGLEHPGIVPVYALGQYPDGRPYYAMRFVRGDSLRRAIERFYNADQTLTEADRNLAFRELLQRFTDVCHAMEYAHTRGVLHRDLKPDNIMIGRFGETLVVDWGLARTKADDDSSTSSEDSDEPRLQPRSGSDSAPTQMGEALGTPAFMSPEQATGRLDLLGPATDVYSLGATLYQILTGQPAFGRSDDITSILLKVERGDFPKPRAVRPETPPQLEAICLKAMARKPEDRYPSPDAVAADIERWLADEQVSVFREPLAQRTRRWIRKHQTVAASLATVVLVALIALGISLQVTRNQKDALDAKNSELERVSSERDQQNRQLSALNATLDDQNRELTRQQSEISRKNTELESLVLERSLQSAEAAKRAGDYKLMVKRTDDLDIANLSNAANYKRALLRVEALVGLNDPVNVKTLMSILPEAPTPELQAQRLLLEGDVKLFDDPLAGVEIIKLALNTELTPVDTEYAKALVAPTFDESIEHLEKVTTLEPLHLRGQALLAMSCLISGHRDRARTVCEFGLRLWPEQIDFQLVLFLIEGAEGNAAAARELLTLLAVKMPEAVPALDVVAETFVMAQQSVDGREPEMWEFMAMLSKILIYQRATAAAADDDTQLRVPPQLGELMLLADGEKLMQVMQEMNEGKSPSDFFVNMRDVLRDGALDLFLGMRLTDRHERDAALQRAVNARSIVAGVRDRALHELLRTTLLLDPPGTIPAQRYIDAAVTLANGMRMNPERAADVAKVLQRTGEWWVGEKALRTVDMDPDLRDQHLLELHWAGQRWGRFLDLCNSSAAAGLEPWPARKQIALERIQTLSLAAAAP